MRNGPAVVFQVAIDLIILCETMMMVREKGEIILVHPCSTHRADLVGGAWWRRVRVRAADAPRCASRSLIVSINILAHALHVNLMQTKNINRVRSRSSAQDACRLELAPLRVELGRHFIQVPMGALHWDVCPRITDLRVQPWKTAATDVECNMKSTQ